eukprot:SAG25_NODE_2441_length_1603_cov_1.371676_2_plen_70_part_00
MGMSLAEAELLSALEVSSGLVCMVCHSNRFNRSFREVRRRLRAGSLTLHHIVRSWANPTLPVPVHMPVR